MSDKHWSSEAPCRLMATIRARKLAVVDYFVTNHGCLKCCSVKEFSLLEEVGQTVSIRGRIIDRLHMAPLFSSEKSTQLFAIQQDIWLGIPGIL